jgi:uncharacterized protein (TIGR02996 family)
MGDEEAFIRQILANPSDDSLRLVYADWLEERGDVRGELLRIQTELARMPSKDKRGASLRKRRKALQSSIDPEWLALLTALRYRAAFAALDRPLTPKDGVSEKRVAEGERRLGIRLPRALRDYYLVAGSHRFNQVHNNLLPPKEWYLTSGKVVFLMENQGVWHCGVKVNDPAGDDPPVFGEYEGTSDRWRLPERCSEFLVTHLYFQAVYGYGMKYRGSADLVTPEGLAKLEETWPFIGDDDAVRAFGKDGQAACLEGGSLYVGGRKRKDFDAIVAEFSGLGVVIEKDQLSS